MGLIDKGKEWYKERRAKEKNFQKEHRPVVMANRIAGGGGAASYIVGSTALGTASLNLAHHKEKPISLDEAKKIFSHVAGDDVNVKLWDKTNAGWGPIGPDGKYNKKGTLFIHKDLLRPSIVAHEAGHAKAFKGFLGKTKHVGGVVSGMSHSHVLAPALAFMLARKELKEGEEDKKLRAAITGGSGTLATARLVPEAEASIRGLRKLKGKVKGKGKLPLALAFGSYALPAAATVIGPQLIMHATSKELEKQKEKKGHWLKVASVLEKTGFAPYRVTNRYVKKTPRTLDKLYRTYLFGKGLEHQTEVSKKRPGKVKPAKTP